MSLAMAGSRAGAKLEHLTEHRDPTPRQAGERVERRDHGGRRRVVAVVDEGHLTEPDQLAAPRRRPACREGGDGGAGRDPGGVADGGGREGVVDRQLAEPGNRGGETGRRSTSG